jgi:hypothetical protein
VTFLLFSQDLVPDPHSFSKQDPDTHSHKKSDPDPHKINLDTKHWFKASIADLESNGFLSG